MRQAVILEPRDLKALQSGAAVFVQVGTANIEIQYRPSLDGKPLWTCPQCGREMSLNAKGPHLRGHRNRDAREKRKGRRRHA